MKHLLVYLKEYKKESILAPLFKLLEAVFELFVPLVIAGIIDRGIPEKNYSFIAKAFGYLFVLALVGLACSLTAQFFAARAATGFATKIRQKLFEKIQSMSFTQIDQTGTSTMITRMTSDINQVQTGVNMFLRLFLRSPIIVFGAMIMAFSIDVKEALIFAGVIPVLSLVVFGIMAVSIPLHKKVQGALEQVMVRTRENLEGVRVIRAFNMENEEKDAFRKENQILANFQNLTGKITAFLNPVTCLIINLAIVLLIYTGAVRVQNGILSQGLVIALWNYMSQILVELIKLANLIILLTKAAACGDRVYSVLNMQEDSFEKSKNSSKKPEEKEHYLQFDHVSLKYCGAGEKALNDLNFSVEKGQTVGIIGGTGSGKTSLVHLLPGFYEVSEGAVYLEGRDLREYPADELRKKTGIVMQKAVLFKGTVRSNLLWGKEDATREEMWKALKTAQADEFVRKSGDGLDMAVAQGGKNFSGGQRQRLTIARALIKRPDILILDDSSSALDYATEAALRKSIAEDMKESTLFIVSQRAASVRHADKIIVLDEGEIVGEGTHESLLNGCKVYQEIYYSQFEKSVEA